MNLLRHELTTSRRGVLAWAVSVAAAVLLYMPFYPSVGGSELVDTYLQMFPPELSSLFGLDMMATGAGYTQASYFGLLGFLLLAIAAIGWGSRSIAGAEETGALELTLAHAVTRWRVLLEATLALLIRVAALSIVGSAFIAALNGPAQLDLAPVNLLAVTVALFLLASLVGAAALFGGAVSGSRTLSTGLGALVAVGAYVLNAVADIANAAWFKQLSPFHWAFGQDPLSTGFDGGGLLKLLAAVILLTVVAGWRFARRDVGT